MTSKVKPKRKLSEIDFSREDAHIALVSKTQGGPANGADYALVLKASNRSPEFIEKVQAITVTMELPDFLSRFFYLWEEDADALAALMGYVEPVETAAMEAEEAKAELDSWMKDRFTSYEILKSLKNSESVLKSVLELTEEEHLSLITDQKYLEGIIEKAKIQKNATGVSGATKSPKGRVSKKKEIPMTQEVEMVEKSQLAAVEKALAEQQTLLQKALETVAKFEAEKKEAITKARFDSVKQAVASEEIATILFKAVGLVEDEAVFVEVVKALGDMKALVEKSAMFQEVGASAEESAPAIEESGVTKLLKAQFGVK